MYRILCAMVIAITFIQTLAGQHTFCGTSHSHATPEALYETIKATQTRVHNRTENTLTIPIVFHIIHNGEPIGQGSNISNSVIYDMLARLNEDFLGLNASFSQTPDIWKDDVTPAGVQFCLPKQDPEGLHTNGVLRHEIEVIGESLVENNIEQDVKQKTAWDASRYYNVWITQIPGADDVVGYTFLPTQGIAGVTGIDGTVIDNRSINSHVLTHETGHYLGLLHPFHQNSCEKDDGLDDTPNMSASTIDAGFTRCTDFKAGSPRTCSEPHMYTNFMDYSPDQCYTSFTKGQVAIIRSLLENAFPIGSYLSRSSLVESSEEVCPRVTSEEAPLQITAAEDFPRAICTSNQLSPTLFVRNTSLSKVDTFKVVLTQNGEVSEYFNYETVMPNEEISLSFDFLPKSRGLNVYKFELLTKQGGDFLKSDEEVFELNEVVANLSLKEDFENYTAQLTSTDLNFQNGWQLADKNSAFSPGQKSMQVSGFRPEIGELYILDHPVFDFPSKDGATLQFDLAFEPNFSQHDSLEIWMVDLCNPTQRQSVFLEELNEALFLKDEVRFDKWSRFEIPLPSIFHGNEVFFSFNLMKLNDKDVTIDEIELKPCGFTVDYEVEGNPCIDSCALGIQLDIENVGTAAVLLNQLKLDTAAFLGGICTGDYALQVLDSTNRCFFTDIISIEKDTNKNFEVKAVSPSFEGALNGSITLVNVDPFLPFIYSWDNGSEDEAISGLGAGTYKFTVVNSQKCTFNDSVFLQNAQNCSALAAALSVDYGSCENELDNQISVSVQGGTEPYTYSWNTGFDGNKLLGVAPGDYSITVADASNCQVILNQTIARVGAVVSEVVYEEPSCLKPSKVTVMPKEGLEPFSINWRNGLSGFEHSNLANGIYHYDLTDARGCRVEQEIQVSFTEAFLRVRANKFNTKCHDTEDGRFETIITGGVSPYTLELNEEVIEPTDLLEMAVGTYQLLVKDSKDCQAQLNFEINRPDSLELVVQEDAQEGFYILTANVMGGTPPYQYKWSTGETTPIIRLQEERTVGLLVQDENDCIVEQNLEVIPLSNELAFLGYSWYPNPTADWLQIRRPNQGKTKFYLFNQLGQLVETFERAETETAIDLSAYPSGIYRLTIQEEGWQDVKSIQIIKK